MCGTQQTRHKVHSDLSWSSLLYHDWVKRAQKTLERLVCLHSWCCWYGHRWEEWKDMQNEQWAPEHTVRSVCGHSAGLGWLLWNSSLWFQGPDEIWAGAKQSCSLVQGRASGRGSTVANHYYSACTLASGFLIPVFYSVFLLVGVMFALYCPLYREHQDVFALDLCTSNSSQIVSKH